MSTVPLSENIPEIIDQNFILEIPKSKKNLNALSSERSKFFRECVDIDKNDFEQITIKYYKFIQEWDNTYHEKNKDVILRGDGAVSGISDEVDRDIFRSSGRKLGFQYTKENTDKILNILKSLLYLDLFNFNRGYQQGDNFAIVNFLLFTDYNEVESFFLLLTMYYKYKWIKMTHFGDKKSYYWDLRLWAPLIQVLIKERPVFFKCLIDKDNKIVIQKLHNFIASILLKFFYWSPTFGSLNISKLYYKNIFIYGFVGLYTNIAGFFFKMYNKNDTVIDIDINEEPGELINASDANSLISRLNKLFSASDEDNEVDQKYLDKIRKEHFTEKQLLFLTLKYNDKKTSVGEIIFAPFKPKTGFLAKVFRGGSHQTKYKWIKIKKNKTKKNKTKKNKTKKINKINV